MTPNQIEIDWLKRWAMYSPEAIALECADSQRSFNYKQCYELSLKLARSLSDRLSIEPGDRVAVLSTNEIEYIFLFFALQRLGAILVPLNFRLAARELSYILADSGSKALIHEEAFKDTVEELDEASKPEFLISLDGPDGIQDFLKMDRSEVDGLDMQGQFDSPCMILYTSGTTGSPKGAIITNSMLFWNSVNTALRLNITSSDRTITFLPLFHTGGWNVLTMPFLHHGAHVILLKKFAPERVLNLCAERKLSILFGVPTTMEMMSRSQSFDKVDLSSLRYAIVGGEPMTVKGIRTWGEKGIPIRQGYGLTEFGPNVFSLNEEDAIRKVGSIGFPNFYVTAKVVDDHGNELGANEVGELILKGPMCMAGYWHNEIATKAAIKDGWLHTGDLVRRDKEGYFYVVGRKKEMYISGGENVYPAEVEKVIYQLEGVKEVAVIGVPDATWGECGKAVVALDKGASYNEQDIIEYCLKNLAKFKTPKIVQFMDELPKGDSGKILKRLL